MQPAAFCVHRQFDIAGPVEFRVDRHYFIYARAGTMRLEAEGRRWTLPPARGALIAAGQPVEVTILSRVTSASILFDAAMLAPKAATAVFDMTPLARELVGRCRHWDDGCAQDDYARLLFRMTAAEIAYLSETPSPCVLPTPSSPVLARALALTEASMARAPDFDAIAREAGLSPRSLARRFQQEMGMTWRETLRRLRVIRAVELLAATPMTVTEVALETGYGSLSAFNAAFRELMGMSPRDYRGTLRD